MVACCVSVSALAANCRDVSGRIAELEAELKAIDYENNKEKTELLEAETASLEKQLSAAEQDRQKAEAEGDSLGVLRAELAITNCKKELEKIRETLAACRLQAELDSYYVDNKDKLVADSEARSRYQCYSSRINITKCHAQEAYLQTRQTELEKKLEIEKRKLELGYSTELEVSAIQGEADANLLVTREVEEELKYQSDLLAVYGEEAADVELPGMLQELEGDFVSQFCNNSAQVAYYSQQISAYSNYIDNADADDSNLQKIQLQLELARLNKQQYELELEKYVRQREKSYRQSGLKAEEYDCEIGVMEQRINNSTILYEKGKLREIDVMELKTQKAYLEYERKCCICDAQMERYILEHSIEN